MAKVVTKKLVKKKKSWIQIYGSNNFESLYLGESLGEKAADLMDRVIEANLGEVTRDMKRQNVKLLFKVNEVKDNKAIADVVGYEIMQGYLRRSVRKNKNEMDDSIICRTKDNIKLRIKPLLMTRSRAQKSLLSEIRKETRKIITAEIANLTYYEAISFVVNYNLQKLIRERIKKIYPLSVCEIRMMTRMAS